MCHECLRRDLPRNVPWTYLVRLADVGEVETGGAIGRVERNARHSALVALTAVRRVVLVPDVDRDVLSLHTIATVRLAGTAWRGQQLSLRLTTIRLTLPALLRTGPTLSHSGHRTMHITPAWTFRQDQRFVSRNSKAFGDRVCNLIDEYLLLQETTIYWKMSTETCNNGFYASTGFLRYFWIRKKIFYVNKEFKY